MTRITRRDLDTIITALEIVELQLKANEVNTYRKFKALKNQLVEFDQSLTNKVPHTVIEIREVKFSEW